jgi:nitrite reductase (NADH) small subunit
MSTWIDVGPEAEVTKKKKVVVSVGDHSVLVVAVDGAFYAMDNICIHRDRELTKGVILNGKLVCPGHQWAFELGTGWEPVKQQCQPTYTVAVHDGMVQVDAESRTTVDLTPAD